MLVFLIGINIPHSAAQCNVKSRMNANATISRVTDSELIYSNDTYQMFSQMKHDGKDYFFVWIVKPLTIDSAKSTSMTIIFEDKSNIKLDFYDVYSESKDSSLNVLFLITPSQVNQLASQAIQSIKIDSDKGSRNFMLVAHKNLVINQLICLKQDLK